MENNLRNLLSNKDKEKYAVEAGVKTHKKLQKISLENINDLPESDLLTNIKNNLEIAHFFKKDSFTEVPVAGYIKGTFVSRRIDRMVINHETKTIDILDYKTDIDKRTFYENYKKQLLEYKTLLKDIYKEYSINCYILWTHDFTLEKV